MNGRTEVIRVVEAFRAKHLPDLIPIDVFSLAEITLRLDIIPFPGFLEKYNIDAGITPDFSGIYVDEESYVVWEKGPLWKQNRLRFSVAHELGHYELHREIASRIRHETYGNFRDWINDESGKDSTEPQANEFAGRLLVPLHRLEKFYDEFAKEFDGPFPNWREREGFRQKFTERTAGKFGVNAEVISIRLDREDLWPAN